MSWSNQSLHVARRAAQYATTEDFRRLFLEQIDNLYQLSLLLTADQSKAEQCFVDGLQEALDSNNIFRDWAGSWAKVVIIKNAIRVIQSRGWEPRPRLTMSKPNELADDESSTLGPLLALGNFDRFVFVMTVLETYTDHDCAVLLDCSLADVRNGRVRALELIGHSVSAHRFAIPATMSVGREN